MGNFEDEIKKKLQEGEMEYNPAHWDQLSNALAATPSLSAFEQKIQDTLSNGEASSAANWEEFSNNFNSLDSFEKGLKEKLDGGESQIPQDGWEKFSDKLADSNLNKFEKEIKDIFNAGKIEYNHAHWKAFEKMLHGNTGKKVFYRAAAAVLLLLGVSYGITESFSGDDLKSDKNNTTLKTYSDSLSSTESKNPSINAIEDNDKIKSDDPNLGTDLKPSIRTGESDVLVEESTFNQSKASNSNTTPPFKKEMNPKNALDGGINKKIVSKQSIAKKVKNIFKISKKVELCSSLELLSQITTPKKSHKLEYQIHPGASLWINIWQNPAVTGIYGRNNISGYYNNNWEYIDENLDKEGEINLTQPLIYLGAYERRLKYGVSLGASYKYDLRRNWNNREITGYLSYSKTLPGNINLRIGSASSYRINNLAVNKLTLRERYQNSENIIETELGEFKGKQQYSLTNHLGAFINHDHFFLGYTMLNAASSSISNENEVIPVKHCAMAGVHSPEVFKINASALFKYEKELFNAYSPGIGLTYNNTVFVTAEYENLVRPKLSIGYNHKRKFRAHATFAIQDLNDAEKELNLDNFVNRQGYINTGVNWNF